MAMKMLAASAATTAWFHPLHSRAQSCQMGTVAALVTEGLRRLDPLLPHAGSFA